MSAQDVAIRDGTLVLPGGLLEADIAVVDGRISAIAPDLEGAAREEIHARGLHVLPGAIPQ